MLKCNSNNHIHRHSCHNFQIFPFWNIYLFKQEFIEKTLQTSEDKLWENWLWWLCQLRVPGWCISTQPNMRQIQKKDEWKLKYFGSGFRRLGEGTSFQARSLRRSLFIALQLFHWNSCLCLQKTVWPNITPPAPLLTEKRLGQTWLSVFQFPELFNSSRRLSRNNCW